uniref:Uncharacterized protein n=1 Tax=Anguilla anguilla TaxID=7936 RepID=A0A0E9PF72_ANGAN
MKKSLHVVNFHQEVLQRRSIMTVLQMWNVVTRMARLMGHLKVELIHYQCL